MQVTLGSFNIIILHCHYYEQAGLTKEPMTLEDVAMLGDYEAHKQRGSYKKK